MNDWVNWYPHVYLMRCEVDIKVLSNLEATRSSDYYFDGLEPKWLGEVRCTLPRDDYQLLEDMRAGRFVKVGVTYQLDPMSRIHRLSAPSTTMMCRNIPVRGTDDICYVRGEKALEQALHSRWRRWRIDDQREFFWLIDEMKDLFRLDHMRAPKPF